MRKVQLVVKAQPSLDLFVDIGPTNSFTFGGQRRHREEPSWKVCVCKWHERGAEKVHVTRAVAWTLLSRKSFMTQCVDLMLLITFFMASFR